MALARSPDRLLSRRARSETSSGETASNALACRRGRIRSSNGHPGRVRDERGEVGRHLDQPLPGGGLLPDRVAEQAASLVRVVLASLGQLGAKVVEDDRRREDPRVRMPDPGTGLPVPARHDHVPDLQVPLEVLHAIPVHPQDPLDLHLVGVLERHPVIGALHHDLAGPPGRDPVEHPDALADHFLLDDEVRVPLRDDPDLPAGLRGSFGRRAVGGDLGRRQVLVARTEGTSAVVRISVVAVPGAGRAPTFRSPDPSSVHPACVPALQSE